MPVQKVSSQQAMALCSADAVYLDVRSVPEFEAGHAPGAYNIPLLHVGPSGMQPNPKFAEVVKATFPADQSIVVACKAGGRSARAAAMLEQLGFANVFDFSGGWSGNTGDPGWAASGGPSTTETEAGRRYEDLER